MKLTGNTVLDQSIVQWLDWDKNASNHKEIKALVERCEISELEKLFGARLTFGTAGIRGRMGPGPSQMNDLVIIQTTQGFVSHLLNEFKTSDERERGVAVGYDGRHNSKRFAELTASIIMNRGVPVYLFPRVCPTPFIPFTIRHYRLAAGIMVTASHNPKEDNGYKVYWANGAQIISPHDKNIKGEILKNLEPWEKSWDTSILADSELLRHPYEEVCDAYFKKLSSTVFDESLNFKTAIKFTYTAMHGVGYSYMVEAFKKCNFQPFVAVEEQKDPDPEFPTVKFPNPEEGKSALNLSFRTADASSSTVIIANDPDADRLAVAEKNPQTGSWRVFTGNELGALLGWWCFYCYTQKHPGTALDDVYMLSSTVSSMILKTMAKAEGFHFIETLTGFKWMGNISARLLEEGKVVLFAFEEAIGFMCGSVVLDKDGISAGVKVAELATFLRSQGQTLADKLADIYDTYGQHISLNSYYFCYDQDITKKLFDHLRNFSGEKNTYPRSILGGKYKVTSVRDLTTGYDDAQPDKKAVLPVSKSSQMITFTFDNGLVVTLRTSGTEPKIKYLTELCASPGDKDTSRLTEVLNTMVTAVVEEFLQPTKYKLVPRDA